MPEKTSRKASGAKAKETTHGPICTVGFCPICAAVTAVQPIRPDAVEHLVSAAREFLLAAKSVLDSRVEQTDGTPKARQRLERIARLDARAAARQVALERGERAIRRPADRHWS